MRILKNEGLQGFKVWQQKNYSQNLRENKHGIIHMSEYARTHGMTNTQFFREHLLARAQGEGVRKEIENEVREKLEKQKDSDFIHGEYNTDLNS